MNFDDLQDELINLRFGEGRRGSIRHWINLRYQQVNSMTTWPWSYPQVDEKTSVDGAVTTTIQNISQVFNVTDDWELSYIPYEKARREFLTANPDTGAPTHWTVEQVAEGDAGRRIVLCPVPDGERTVRVTGKSRPAQLTEGTDIPVWPTHWHYVLVLGATATGLKAENDPTWEALEMEFNSLVAAMKDELLPAHQPEPMQYGRDMLGYESWPWQ